MREYGFKIMAFPGHLLRAPLAQPYPMSITPARKYRLPLRQLQLKKNARDHRTAEGGPDGLGRNSCCTACGAQRDIFNPACGSDAGYANVQYIVYAIPLTPQRFGEKGNAYSLFPKPILENILALAVNPLEIRRVNAPYL